MQKKNKNVKEKNKKLTKRVNVDFITFHTERQNGKQF